MGGGAPAPLWGFRRSPTIDGVRPQEPTANAMSKKKDCFGSETYVCRTSDCPYMAECVQVVWDKKLRRIVSQKDAGATAAGARMSASPSVRVRSKDFLQGG
jgi:hypothetical protein